MNNLRTDRGCPSLPAGRLVAALLATALLYAGCKRTPTAPPAKQDERGRALQEIADYAVRVRQQSDEELKAELEQLQAAPESPGRALRMALITGQRQSALYDPDRTAQLLAQVAGQGPETSVHVQLAQALLSVLPVEQRQCAATECEEKLTALVQVEELRRRDLTSRIDSLGRQLESERRERAKLESQLEALKSLEEQIQNRDGPQSP